jgi:hypothetical protein
MLACACWLTASSTLPFVSAGNRAGWLGVGWRPSTFDGIVRSAGYPGDKPFGSLWSTSCRVSDANTTDARFEARCDVSPGEFV